MGEEEMITAAFKAWPDHPYCRSPRAAFEAGYRAASRVTRPPSEEEVERAARASRSHTIGEQVSDEQWATMRDVEIPAMRAGLSVLEGRDV